MLKLLTALIVVGSAMIAAGFFIGLDMFITEIKRGFMAFRRSVCRCLESLE